MPTRAITNDDGGTGAREVMAINESGAPIPTVASAMPPKSTQSSPALKSWDLSPSPTPPKAALGSGQLLPSASAKANQKKPSDSWHVLSQPQLPILVLLTWGNTFYAPPRGDVLSTDSPLRKTFNIISCLLMTPPLVDPELAEYQREWRNQYFSGDHTSCTDICWWCDQVGGNEYQRFTSSVECSGGPHGSQRPSNCEAHCCDRHTWVSFDTDFHI